MKTTVFVYEYLCALGASGDIGSPLAPSLLREGTLMLEAVVADFRSADVEVMTVLREDSTAFRELAARADFSLVIAPEFDGLLEARCRLVEQAGGRLLGPSSAAVRLTADKYELFRHFERTGIRTPHTWLLGEEPPTLYPRIWKPRFGAGSQDTYSLDSAADVAAIRIELNATNARAPMIAQERVDGVAASVAFVIGTGQRLALQPCFQHLSTDGRYSYMGGSTPIPDDLARRAVAIASRAVEVVDGLQGYVGIDVVLGAGPDNDWVIEINPRLTTSYIGLRQSARFNIADLMLRVARSLPLPKLGWDSKKIVFLS